MGNSVSDFELPNKGKYGLKHEHRDINDSRIKHLKKRSYLDNFSMKDSFPPIDEQGDYATSVACAISSILEFEQIRYNRNPISISKLYLHALGKGRIRKTLQRIYKHGLVSEYDLPYNSLPPFPEVDNTFYAGCLDFMVVPFNVEVVNSALYAGYPILIGLNIYKSFNQRELWNNDGVMPIPQKGESFQGSLGAVITGYSAIKEAYEIRLSWGTKFKNSGYFYMNQELVEDKYITCSLWAMRLYIPEDKKAEQDTEEVVVETPKRPQEGSARKKFHLGS